MLAEQQDVEAQCERRAHTALAHRLLVVEIRHGGDVEAAVEAARQLDGATGDHAEVGGEGAAIGGDACAGEVLAEVRAADADAHAEREPRYVPDVGAAQLRSKLRSRGAQIAIGKVAAAIPDARRDGHEAQIDRGAGERAATRRAAAPESGANRIAGLRAERRARRFAALADQARVGDALEILDADRALLAGGDGDAALEQRLGAAPAHEVAPGLHAEPAHAIVGADLGDDRALGVVGDQQVARALGEAELGAAIAGPRERGQHDLGVAGELVVERRVLRAAERAARRAQRVVVGVAIGLGDRDRAVAVEVGGAEQARDQIVGEERAAQRVGLLRVLARRARGPEHDAVARHLGIERDLEPGLDRAALDPGQRAGAARVEDQHAQGGGRAAHQLLELREIERAAPEVERAGVGVAGVIDDELGLRGLAAQAIVERDQRAPHGVGVLAAQQY